MPDDEIKPSFDNRQEAMPEYERVKNKCLDLLDESQDALTRALTSLYNYQQGKMERKELLNSSGDAAIKMIRLYQYLRPKIRRNNEFPKKYASLGRMELYAWGTKTPDDLAENLTYMLGAYNRMREFLEEIKLTKFEKEKNPYLELLHSNQGE